MGVAKKGRGNNFQNCSTSSKVLYGCQLVISGEKSFLARSATICKINTVWLPTRNCLVSLNWKWSFWHNIKQFFRPKNSKDGILFQRTLPLLVTAKRLLLPPATFVTPSSVNTGDRAGSFTLLPLNPPNCSLSFRPHK